MKGKTKTILINGNPTVRGHCDNCGTYTRHYIDLTCVLCGHLLIKLECSNCKSWNDKATRRYKCYVDESCPAFVRDENPDFIW